MRNFIFIALVNTVFALSVSAQSDLEFSAVAYKLGTDEVVYLEKHKGSQSAEGIFTLLETNYLDKNNQLFAKKISKFEKNIAVPDDLFEDYRFKMKQESFLETENKKLIVKLSKEGKEHKNGSIKVREDWVGGSGFHNYIIKNLDRLLESSEDVSFIVQPKIDEFSFIIKKVKRDENLVTFEVRPENFILRTFVDPLKLTYDLKVKRLLVFEGMSNIDDEKGNTHKVRIEYKYESSKGAVTLRENLENKVF